MLKYGRDEKNDVLRFSGHERHKPFLRIIIFIMGIPPSNFAVVNFDLCLMDK